MNYQLRLGLLIACLLFLFSCQKEEILDQEPTVEATATLENIIGDDSLMDKFFNGVNDHDVPVSDDKKATVDQIKLAMAKDHKTTPFVGDYIRQVGFPLWGQAKLQQQADGDFLYALPFAKANSAFTTAILHIAVQEEKFVYELALRTDINEYLAAYSSGNQTFYWENLLAFLGGFNEYDNGIFNFHDSLFIEWFGQNKDTYLTDAADTRGCESYVYTVCVWNITLQESGEERSSGCDGTTYQVIVTICSGPDNPGAPGPHQPGGQSGGVPGLGGSGGSSGNAGSDPGSDPGPGENPGIDPNAWGDEGGNNPSDITEAVCIYNATSSFVQTYEIQVTTEIQNLLRNIEGCEGMNQETFNQLAIDELIRDRGVTPKPSTISILARVPQSLDWVLNNIETVNILNSLTVGNLPLTPEIQAGGEFFLHSMKNNLSTLPADNANLNTALEQFWPGPTIPTVGLEFGLDLALQVEQEVMFLREVHKDDPSWTNNWLYAHAIKKVFSGTTHTLLQLCGLIEGPGIVCDGIDALFYLAEGDGKNAAMSSMAMVPFLGLTAPGQRAYKRITSALGGTVALKYGTNAAGAVVDFGRSSQLATVIGRIAGHQAHHMIPWALNGHEVVQRAARHGWHPNDFINGISLPLARHSGSHQNYTNAVVAKLEEINQLAGNNGAQTVQLLDKFAADLFIKIETSTAHINSNAMVQLINSIVI